MATEGKSVRLRRTDPTSPGLRRIRRGRGFSYADAEGKPVDAATRERLKHLGVPPAWKDVWLSPYPNGHIQAVGTDDAGRRQYLYHEEWVATRSSLKHERIRALAVRLPRVRKQLASDLRRPDLDRNRVLAIALRLLDAGLFRTGGEEYEQEHGSHGVSTLLRDHVVVSRGDLAFRFPAKSGVLRETTVSDGLVAKAVTALKRSRTGTDRLLCYKAPDGWHEVHAEDVNARFKELVGEAYTVKDLRTWAATVSAAVALAQAPDPVNKRTADKAVREAVVLVAEHLGNTPAVARRSYVDPTVIDQYTLGRTVQSAVQSLRSPHFTKPASRAAIEKAVLRLLRNADD